MMDHVYPQNIKSKNWYKMNEYSHLICFLEFVAVFCLAKWLQLCLDRSSLVTFHCIRVFIFSHSVWFCDDVRSSLSASPAVRTHQQHCETSHRRDQLCGELPQTSSRAGARNWSVVSNFKNDELDRCFGELVCDRFYL